MNISSLLRRIFQRNLRKEGMADPKTSHAPETHAPITNSNRFYQHLFSKVEKTAGTPLDPNTITAIIDFSAGGPVSLRSIHEKRIYLTCELAMQDGQQPSADGALRYELMTEEHFSEDTARALLTALGNLSQNAILGKGHTIDVSWALESDDPYIVKLELVHKFSFEKNSFGIYRVIPAN